MAVARWHGLRRGRASVVVKGGVETTVLQLEAGSLVLVRRCRSCDDVAERTGGNASAVISGDAADTVPAAVAARYASRATRRLEFAPESEREKRAVRDGRIARWLFAAAAACLIAAAGTYRWGLERQLGAVVAERAALRARVGRAMAARDSLAELARSASSIASLEASAPRWSAVLARVAVTLPTDALVDVFRGDADSVSMQGQATNAAAVFSALRGAPGVASVRSNAPIRQELLAGHEASERWMLTLHVLHGVAARNDQ